MIIIGEKINSSIKEVHSAIAQMDELVIANLAKLNLRLALII